MQSNFGVVTKLALWLMPEPEVIATGTIVALADEDIVPLIDALAPLVLDGTIQGQPLIGGNPVPQGGRPQPGTDPATLTKAQRFSSVFPAVRWSARISFYGAAEIVDARISRLRRAITHIPGASVELRNYPGDVAPDQVRPDDLVPAGIPNQVLLEVITAVIGNRFGHVDFSPVLPFTGEAALRFARLVETVLNEEDLAAGFAWIGGPRTLTGAIMVFFDVDDDEERERAFRAVARLVDAARAEGWAEYRSHPRLVEDVAAIFDHNDRALSRLYTRIKDALDPAGVLSPGNHGIWPSAPRRA